MRTHILPLVALFAAGSGLSAQPAPHTRTLPKVAAGTFANSVSSFPFGRNGGKAQYWFRRDQIHAPGIVTAIGSRPSRNQTATARTQSLELTAANTALAHGQFTKAFAQNLGANPTIVYARKNVSIPSFAAHANFDQPGMWIFLDAPFPLTGPNLVLDFDLGSAVGAASASYNGDLINLSGTGLHWTSDPGCGGVLAASATAATFTLTASGLTPSVPAFFLLSLEAASWAGLPLPFKLDGFGMPGCLLGVDPQFMLPAVADASGGAVLTGPLPTPNPAVVLYGQVLHPVSTTPLGLATTNVTRSILGSVGFCSYIYNFTVDGPSAQNGPNNWQGVLLLQP